MAELNVAVRVEALKMPLRKALETAARLGATAVELDARNQIHPSQLSDTGLRQLRKILDDLNLRVAALRFQTRRGYDNPEQLDRRVEATKAAMQLAYRLDCRLVVNAVGSIPDSEDDPRWGSMHSRFASPTRPLTGWTSMAACSSVRWCASRRATRSCSAARSSLTL